MGRRKTKPNKYFIILNNPDGCLQIGRQFRKGDFVNSLIDGRWPNGLKVRNENGRIFTVRHRKTKRHCLVSGNGEIYEIIANAQIRKKERAK
jgi:hypothetical protein